MYGGLPFRRRMNRAETAGASICLWGSCASGATTSGRGFVSGSQWMDVLLGPTPLPTPDLPPLLGGCDLRQPQLGLLPERI
jgi:hypothetical protein